MARDPFQRPLRMIEKLPISIRELSRRAGVSHVLLIRARDGHERLSPAAARKVITALREMGAELESAADTFEEALEKTERNE